MPRGMHDNHCRGSNHYRWNGSKIISSSGYVKIRVGTSHPLSDPNGYAYEHLLVVLAADTPEARLLRERPEQYVIHHVNDDKTDNRFENLAVIDRAEHNRLHNAQKGRNSKGQFVGKKAAGRLLDGQEWNQFPGSRK